MQQSNFLRPQQHRRCSSTPPAGHCDQSSTGPGINYTYSFRRAEHVRSWAVPPSYDSIFACPTSEPSYTFSPVRPRSRGGSFAVTPLTGTDSQTPWTAGPQRRTRSNSSPISPVTPSVPSFEQPTSYVPYRPGHATNAPSHPHELSPNVELPSPFASPLFYWSGESRQVSTASERMHQAQADDLSLMSPYGSPSFYWNGMSKQEEQAESTLDKAKRTLDRLRFRAPHVSRPPAKAAVSNAGDPVWDERYGAYVVTPRE